MEPSKTFPEFALAESCFVIRPGTICHVELVHNKVYQVTWDSATEFDMDFSGFVSSNSVICSEDISDSLTVEKDGDDYNVHIDPIDSGTLGLSIYYLEKSYFDMVSKIAFSSADSVYYKDYEIYRGVIYPKTIIEIPVMSDPYIIRLESFKVTHDTEVTGITFYNNIKVTTNSSGLLEYNNERAYILREGKEEVVVPVDSDLPYMRIMSTGEKLVEIDNTIWQSGYSAVYGLMSYMDQMFVMTNKSLCIFDMNGNFVTPELENEEVIGKDLTLLDDGHILVSNGTSLVKYRIKHDNVYLDRNEKKLYFREIFPEIDINVK